LRRRAALEHVIAGISTRLIDAKPNELEIVPDLPILVATASADDIRTDALVAAGTSEVVHRPVISA
jgi:hypothetical protein